MNDSRHLNDEPLIERASAALRSRTHADDAARAALVRALAEGKSPRRIQSPRAVRYRLAVGLAAGIVLAVGISVALSARGGLRLSAGRAAPANTTIVEFSFDAPAARLVSVVGEFNQWNGEATPMRRTANGRWTANLALAPGRHTYGFEVDGDDLVPDPHAPVAPEHMFGVRHSVVVVPKGVKF